MKTNHQNNISWQLLLVLCFVLLPLGNAQTKGPIDFNLSLSNNQLVIISKGIVSPLVSQPSAVQGLPVPEDVNQISLVWSVHPTTNSTSPNVTVLESPIEFSISVRVFDYSSNETLDDALTLNFTVGNSGIVPETQTGLDLLFLCQKDGISTAAVTFTLGSGNPNSTTNSTLKFTFYLAKRCGSTTTACDACGTCLQRGSCKCIEDEKGSVCSLKTSKSTADPVENLKVLSWNLAGTGSSESLDQMKTRHTEILGIIQESDYSVLCFQEVWNPEIRDLLVENLQGDYPFITMKTFGNGPSRDSGLFFASKFPILEQNFEEFTSSQSGTSDALTDKGIFGALIRIRDDALLYVFNTHCQAGSGSSIVDVQTSQMRQIRRFIESSVKSATNNYAILSVSVLLVGDLNVNALQESSVSITYSTMLDLLNDPKDAFKEVNGDDVGATTRFSTNCTAQLASTTGCTVGTIVNREGRVDYGFGYDVVADQDIRPIKFLESSVKEFQATQQTAFGTRLSDHFAVDFEIDFAVNYLVVILTTVLIGGTAIIITALVLIQLYIRKKPIPAPKWAYTYARQTIALLRKNMILTLRNKRALTLQLVVPFLLVGLLWVLQFALVANAQRNDFAKVVRHSDPKRIDGLPRCYVGKGRDTCITFAYTPSGDPVVDRLMARIAEANSIPAEEVMSFATPAAADDYLRVNTNSTQGVYNVQVQYNSSTATTDGFYDLRAINYTIQFNSTVVRFRRYRSYPNRDIFMPMYNAIEQAIIWYKQEYFTSRTGSGPSDFELLINSIPFPHPDLITVDVIGSSGPAFFLGCLMFNFVIQMGQLVSEKELHLREAMTVVGLRDSVYWATWVFNNFLWNSLTAILLILAGLIFQFDFFLKNDFGTYFFLFFLFGMAMVSFAIFLSLFVSRARTATSVGFAIFLVGVIAQGAAGIAFSEGTDDAIQGLLSLLPFVLLAKGMRDLGEKSDNEGDTGLRWTDRDDYGYFPIGTVYNWLIFDCVFYLILALLIDFLFGGVHGESRVRRWLAAIGNKANSNTTTTINVEEMEELPSMKDDDVKKEEIQVKQEKHPNSVIVLQNLTKVYKNYTWGVVHDKKRDFTAVNGVWLHIEGGQLFCLLGHNGAGKSTTISMLTGLQQASDGDAKIMGYSLRTDVDKIREHMGVCPQHDILWSELTAAEHIKLFGALKGLPAEQVEAEVQERLGDVDLLKVKDQASGGYSGGMKRRLSVAIALTGNPSVVYLDEPTTGMDPVSRRQVWNLLEKEKRKRLVVLTTHYMEEADMLGDNIAIIKQGQLCCLGSALHLKSKYGKGNRVSVVTDINASEQITKNIEKVVAKLLPTAKLSRKTPGALHYEVVTETSDQLPSFLREIEETGESLGIIDVQVGMTSLEDVFLLVAGLEEELAEEVVEDEVSDSVEGEEGHKTTKTNDPVLDDVPHMEKQPSTMEHQFKALFAKSFVLQKRQYKTNLCQLLFPLVLVLVLFGFQQLVTSTLQKEQGETIPAIDHPPAYPPTFLITATFDIATECPSPTPGESLRFDNLILDTNSGEMLYAMTPGVGDVGNYGPQVTPSSYWETNTDPATQPRGLLGNVTRDITQMVGIKGTVALRQGNRQIFCLTRPYLIPVTFSPRDSKDALEDVLYDAWGSQDRMGAFVFDQFDLNNGKFEFTIVYNQTLTQERDVPTLGNLITNAVFKLLSRSYGSTSGDMKLVAVRDYPTPEILVDFDLISLIGPAFYIFIFQLLFPVILGGLVYEKEYKLREIMKMMGLKTSIYWTVNYVIYFGMFLIAILAMVGLGAALSFRVWTVNDFLPTLLLIIFWGNTMVSMAFMFSAFFTNSRTAVVFGYIFLFATGLLSSQLIQSYFVSSDTPPAITFIVCLIPSFSLYRGLLVLSNSVAFNAPGLTLAELGDGTTDMGDVYGFLIVEWIVMLILAAYFEMVVPSGVGVKQHPLFFLKKSFWQELFNKDIHAEGAHEREFTDLNEPEDVAGERRAAYEDPDGKKFVIRMLNLHKEYPTRKAPKIAVKNLTMGIAHGECFGLLGPNGSGKSTTVNMLCGYFSPTTGTAYMAGLDLRREVDLIHLMMGVCPQDNIIWEELTGGEHLRFYGRLKDLEGEKLEREVKYRLQQVNLWSVVNKKAGQYSGGMKRRLCVAISLIGTPKMILMDEPTTGLDPKARKSLWQVIRTAKKKSSLLLTTHSMEEAEALCERVGIFVNGEMKSIGTPSRLKAKFGEDFKLTLTTPLDQEQKAHELVTQVAPDATVFNIPVAGTRSYQIPKNKTKLSSIFEAISKWIDNGTLNIQDWGVSNITLEEVFLQITHAEQSLPNVTTPEIPLEKGKQPEQQPASSSSNSRSESSDSKASSSQKKSDSSSQKSSSSEKKSSSSSRSSSEEENV